MLGNPVTDYYIDDNSRIPFIHRVSLISDEYYEVNLFSVFNTNGSVPFLIYKKFISRG